MKKGPYRAKGIVLDDLPRKKVVCRDCKHYGGPLTLWIDEQGKQQSDLVYSCLANAFDKATGERTNTFRNCAAYNSDNDCVLYRRKWWKFWAPRKG